MHRAFPTTMDGKDKEPSMSPVSASEPARVLVIDDSKVVRVMVSQGLRKAGFEVDEADGGPSAMELLFVRAYDVIVTDLHMPEPDGFQILETIKLRDLGSEVVILTGSHAQDINAAIRALRLGANDYLTKPLAGVAQAVIAVERAVEKKRQREELRAAQEKYRDLFDNVPIGLYRSAPDGTIEDANPALVQLLGYSSRESLLAVNAAALYVDPEDRRRWMEIMDRDGLVSGFEFRVRRRNGTVAWMEESTRAHRGPDGRTVQYEGSLQDVTERRRVMEELHEAQKMEAIGRLAGGIAHDFNNALGIVLGAAGLMARRTGLDALLQRDLQRIQTAAERAAHLTRQLLAFGRKQVLRPRTLDLNCVLHGMQEMLRSLAGEQIDLRLALASDLDQVTVDPAQIEQAIINLVTNACDAMLDGGKLTIETSNIELDATRLERHAPTRPGRYVMLAVADTGAGMDEGTLSHVFEPFFATTMRDKGTELGLPTVYGIIKQSGGYVRVYSEVGVGTCVKIFLPRVPAAAEEDGAAKSPSDAEELLRGDETVLIVEDEDDLRMVLSRGLESHGYTVLAASNGPDSLELAKRHPGRIDLLVADLIMPQMNGTIVADKLRDEDQCTKVLYISAYSDTAAQRHEILPHDAAFMQKPFTLHSFCRRVREILDQDSPAHSTRRQ
jgi:two-component system cell cycle sensor histidine kinase/response regulator CckA